jgi:large repetitive protein
MLVKKAANRTLAGFALVGMFSGSVATFTAASNGEVADESVATGPSTTAEPVSTDPVVEPVGTDPVVEPVGTDPVVEPVGTDPVVEPVGTDPVVEPVGTDPVVEPSTTAPSSTIANGIGGVVWDDVDRDGVDDGNATEPRLVGVSIAMTALGTDGAIGGGDDIIVGTFTTDGDGVYLASDLADGSYLVEVTSGLPATYLNTVDPQGTASPDGRSITAVAGGQVDLGQNFGYGAPAPTVVPDGSIGGVVFSDPNGNGEQDALEFERGIRSVTITLTNVGSGLVVQTTTSDDGTYLFEELAAGSYVVAISAGVPAILVNTGDPDGGNDAMSAVELSEGEKDRDQDFGFAITTVGTSSISGTIFVDRNGDGVRSDDEPVVAGQRVDLMCSGRDRHLKTADDPVASIMTDQGGGYVFAGLAPGFCRITVVGGIVDAASNTGDPDGGNDSTSMIDDVDGVGPVTDQDFGYQGDNSVGDLVYFDANSNSTDDGASIDPRVPNASVKVVWDGLDSEAGTSDDVSLMTVTDAQGAYRIAGLPDGSYTVELDLASVPAGTFARIDPDGGAADGRSATTLSDGEVDGTQDFGLGATGMIGDTVWLDLDADGVRDSAEPGLVGATVTVRGTGFDGIPNTDDDLGATTTVNADGRYLFDTFPAGVYRVSVSGIPAGISATSDPDGGLDSTSSIDLGPAESDLDQDFGYIGTSGVGDTVFVDTNGNKLRDGAEVGVANLTITVSSPGVDGVRGTADDVIVRTVTDANGNYLVIGLPSGSTIVSFESRALPDGLDPLSDADGGVATVTTVNLMAGETNRNIDFAVGDGSQIPVTPQPGGLIGVVFNDPNRNSRQDDTERGVPGVTVTLVNSVNAEVARTTTDSDGVFEFDDLVPGVYTVIPVATTLPSGTSIVTETDGTVDGRTTVTVTAATVTPSGDFGIALPAAVSPPATTTPPASPTPPVVSTPPRTMPRTGSSGVGRMLEIALAALITGFGLMLIRRRPQEDTA